MPVRSTSHFTWQVLRAVKRSKKPPTGRTLRLVPSRKTMDGTFLNAIVDEGRLVRVMGSADAPFEATYALTEKGQARRRVRVRTEAAVTDQELPFTSRAERR